MRKIKDFIYDYNDVLVALFIVIAAAIIIVWRVDVVMDYNGYLTGTAKNIFEKLDIDFSGIDLSKEHVDDIVEVDDSQTSGSGIISSTTTPAIITTEPAIETTQPAVETTEPAIETSGSAVENTDKKEEIYTLEVSKEKKTDSWQSVGTLLEKNGIIESKSAFISRVTERNVGGKLKLKTSELTTGLTLDEVIDILIK